MTEAHEPTRSSGGRWWTLLIAGVVGGLIVIGVDRVHHELRPGPHDGPPLRGSVGADSDESSEPVEREELNDEMEQLSVAVPPPGDPEPAREALIETLVGLGIPATAIDHGIYALRGTGRSPDATLPLVAFTCPPTPSCDALLTDASQRLAMGGYETAYGRRNDSPGRPVYRALSREGRPLLAMRGFPPGARLTLIIDALGDRNHLDPTIIGRLLRLDEHVTFAVLTHTAAGQTIADRLIGEGREVLAQIPMAGRARGFVPRGRRRAAKHLITLEHAPEAVAERVHTLLDAVPGVAGAINQQGAQVTTSRAHVVPMLQVIKSRGLFVVDRRSSPASVIEPTARAIGVRTATRSHVIDGEPETLPAALRGIEATLVLDGHALVIVRADSATLASLELWLADLAKKQIHLLRTSEVVR